MTRNADQPIQSALTELSAVAAVTAMHNGDLRAEDYASALLNRAEQMAHLNAFRTIEPAQVLDAAHTADRLRASGAPLGPLHGLPIPVKDSIDSKSLPTSNGTLSLRDFVPREDAGCLTRLFAAGAILMGKTNLHELSYGWTSNNAAFGPVCNPFDLKRIAGGSSGGSGAAVAARIAPLALAEDTLGSIRVPASMCGLAGFRPSYGRYPNGGVLAQSDDRFDQIGPLARSVADLALFDSVMTGNTGQSRKHGLSTVRIGIAPDSMMVDLDPEVERVCGDALERIRAAGATLVEVALPLAARAAMATVLTIIAFETVPLFTTFLQTHCPGLLFEDMLRQTGTSVRAELESYALPPGRPSPALYQQAVRQLAQIQTEMRQVFALNGLAALAFPPVMVAPPLIGEEVDLICAGTVIPLSVAMARNTALGSAARMASLVLPAGFNRAGLPIGLEFAALEGQDAALLHLGQALEDALACVPRAP